MKQVYLIAKGLLGLGFLLGVITLGWAQAGSKNQSLDCDDAQSLCGSVDITFKPLGRGKNDFANGNNKKGCLTVENNTIWYVFEIETPGTLTFVLSPDKENTDYDFSVWGPNPDCNNLGEPIRCNSSQPFGDTGLSLDSDFITQGPGPGSVWSKYMDVLAGEKYIMVIDNFSKNTSSFKIKWGGTAILKEEVEAAFTNEVTCDKLSTKNLSKGCYLDKFTYLWTLTDASGAVIMSSTDRELNYRPAVVGNFLLTLICTSPTGKVVQTSQNVTLEAPLSAKFEANRACKHITAHNKSSFCGSVEPAYKWELKNAVSGSLVHTTDSKDFSYAVTQEGTFLLSLAAHDAFGKTSVHTDTFVVHIPKLMLMKDSLTCFEDDSLDYLHAHIFNEQASYPYKWAWHNEKGEVLASSKECLITQGGEFMFLVDAEGCRDSVRLRITPACKAEVWIPTAFTPNNDQLNDVFQLFGKYGINYDFWVYNQWGLLVYANSGAHIEEMQFWNGLMKGQGEICPSGEYSWILKYYSPELPYKPIQKHGSVALIR